MLARDRYDWCGISASVAVLRQALAEAAAGCDAPRLCRLPGFATYLRCASESERLSPCVACMCHAACICLDERARLRTSPLFAGSGVVSALAGGDRRSRHGSAASRQRALDRVMFMPFVFVVARCSTRTAMSPSSPGSLPRWLARPRCTSPRRPTGERSVARVRRRRKQRGRTRTRDHECRRGARDLLGLGCWDWDGIGQLPLHLSLSSVMENLNLSRSNSDRS